MKEEVVISVDNVSKDFILPHLRKSSVKSVFTGAFDKSKRRRSSEVQHALKNISFEIKKGEFFGIVGRNGSGKSTLLKILAGIYQPTKGEINVKGKIVPFIELGVGFNPELTGRENVYLNGALLGFSEKEVSEMYDSVVEFAELERFMDQKLKNYSSGMQVRLAFSMAIRAEAEILIIDEVLAVGDADFQRKCFEFFKSLKKTDTTIVFVSHDMDAVKEYCDRALLVDDTKLIKVDIPELIAQRYIKLFQNLTESEYENNNSRWGNKAIITKSLKVEERTQTIRITQEVLANEKVDDFIAGFTINGLDGKAVTGSNSKILQLGLPSLNPGQHLNIEWSLPNILSTGKYTVCPAIVMSDGVTVCDWWEQAKIIEVRKDRKTPYNIDPGIEAKVLFSKG